MAELTLPPNRIQNEDDFIVVFISSEDIPVQLLNKIACKLKKFDSNDDALIDISRLKSDRKVFLILTQLESLKYFKNLSQIQSIYILQDGHRNIELIDQTYSNLIGIFDNLTELINRLCKDMLLIYRDVLQISVSSINEIRIEQSLTNINDDTVMFLWNQILVHYLIESSYMGINIDMEESKEIMLKQCRIEYENNKTTLNDIETFRETANANNILQWYTKDGFLYRLLNKVFRTQNTELICKFQYAIILLYQKFQSLSICQTNDPKIVYRGQSLDPKTIEKLKANEGHLISMNTMLSTSRNETTARGFIQGAISSVIFKIHIPEHIANEYKPFIDIAHLSSMRHEEEILFFIGTVFLINSVTQENDSNWIIELTLHHRTIQTQIKALLIGFYVLLQSIKRAHLDFMQTDDYNMIKEYFVILTGQEISPENTIEITMTMHFAFMLSNLGLFTHAIQLYKRVISENKISNNTPQFIVINLIIGYLHYHAKEYNEALESYDSVVSLLDKTNLLTTEVYKHIGDVWQKMGDEDLALFYYEQALEIANHEDFPSSRNLYQNLIDLLERRGRIEETDVYKQKINNIDRSRYHIFQADSSFFLWLQEMESQLANKIVLTTQDEIDSLYRVGLYSMTRGQFDIALEQLLRVRDSLMTVQTSWAYCYRQWPTILDNIALLYLFKGEYLKALITWKKSIDVRRNTPSSSS